MEVMFCPALYILGRILEVFNEIFYLLFSNTESSRLVSIFHVECISVWITPILSAQQPHSVRASILDRAALNLWLLNTVHIIVMMCIF